MILSIALISKKNRPLYISSKELQHHLLSYSALDVFNERLAANSDKVDCDFGLLFYADQTSVYGYCTNTGIKFVVLIAGGQVSPDIKLIFKQIHVAYISLCCNPFYAIDDEEDSVITSLKFQKQLEAIIMQFP